MENELPADYETDGDEYVVAAPPTAYMHFTVAFLFGAWYSIILASAMSAGVKYLHPETPDSHGILQSGAWALGSGIAIALASCLSKSHRLAVGVCSTFVSVSVWIALLYFLRRDLDKSTGDNILGHPLSVGNYLIILSSLILIVGLASSFLGASSRNDEELTAQLLLVPSRHWLWLWIAGFAWVSMLPIVAYYLWLQIATALYSVIHPSLWFQVGSGLVFGFLGIASLFKGIEISLKAVSDKSSYGGVVWKRVLMFLAGTLVLASLVAPFLLNLDINRMKDMPASLGAHPWWVLSSDSGSANMCSGLYADACSAISFSSRSRESVVDHAARVTWHLGQMRRNTISALFAAPNAAMPERLHSGHENTTSLPRFIAANLYIAMHNPTAFLPRPARVLQLARDRGVAL